MILIDTDILIDHLRGVPKATTLLERNIDSAVCSMITRAELFARMRPNEKSSTQALVSIIDWIPVTDTIADRAAAYRKDYGKSHGVLLPDTFIAATAAEHGAVLFTRNTKHYPMSDIKVVKPY